MRKNIAILSGLILFILSLAVSARAIPKQLSDTESISTTKEEVRSRIGVLRIPFIKHEAKFKDREVKYCAKIMGGGVLIDDNSIAYDLSAGTGHESRRWAIKEKLYGSKKTQVEGLRRSPTRVNLFVGNDKTTWKSNITTFEEVSFGEVYDYIRLNLKAYGMNVEKVFSIEKGGNPEEIAIKVEGAKNLKINQDGELEITRGTDILKMTAPSAYQEIGGEKVRVATAYTLKNPDAKADDSFVYGFKVGEYDRTRALVIDPLPKPQATFLGGLSEDRATAIVVVSGAPIPNKLTDLDSNENVYVVGYTGSTDFYVGGEALAYDYGKGGGLDIFVAKLDHDLKNLISIAFIGGSKDDFGNSIALDSAGNVYVAGYSSSNDFPGIMNPRGTYAFILKLSPDLSSLNASRIALAGTSADYANSVAIDPANNIYVVGYTILTNNDVDAFVSKHGADLSLIASRRIGGSDSDYAYSVAVHPTGFIYVAGATASTDFPTTFGAYDVSQNGGLDAFVVKLDGNLNIHAATFIGGSDNDVANSIAISQTGDVYITGWTASTAHVVQVTDIVGGLVSIVCHPATFPTTPGAYDRAPCSTGVTEDRVVDVFVAKFNPELSTLLASTFLGGTKSEQANSIVLDKAGSVYVTGWTSSLDFPTSVGAFDSTLNGGEDAFISHLDGNLSTLLASTLLGGLSDDVANGIALDSDGNVFVTGYTNSINFIPPQMDGGFDTVYHGSWDAFVYRQRPDLSKVYSLTVTLLGNGHGRVTSSPSGIYCLNSPGSDCEAEFNSAATVTLTEAPSTDSSFNGWTGACILPLPSPDTCVVAVNDITSVAATFKLSINTFTIQATADTGGTISPSGAVVVNYGGSMLFSVKPDPGPPRSASVIAYQGSFVEDLLVDGASVGPLASYTFKNVTQDHSISASFTQKKPRAPYTIMSTANSGGTITPSGVVKVAPTMGRNFIIRPKKGYHILDLRIDDQSKGPFSNGTRVFSYMFTGVTASHTIEVIFAPNGGQ
jgi:hypothetical protein